MAKITVDLNDDQHLRFTTAKVRLKLKSLQALMIHATDLWLSGALPADNPPPLSNERVVSGIEPIPELETPEGPVPVTAEEWAWVSRVLHVVRGGCEQALNLIDASVLLTDLLTAGSPSDKSTYRLPEPDPLKREVEKADLDADKTGGGVAEIERIAGTGENPPEDLRTRKQGTQPRPRRGRGRKSA